MTHCYAFEYTVCKALANASFSSVSQALVAVCDNLVSQQSSARLLVDQQEPLSGEEAVGIGSHPRVPVSDIRHSSVL